MLEGMKIDHVLAQVLKERYAQIEKWGQQDHPILDLDLPPASMDMNIRYSVMGAGIARELVEELTERGELTYMDILIEEVQEVLDALTLEEQRKELIQVAAVAVAMIERIDRHQTEAATPQESTA